MWATSELRTLMAQGNEKKEADKGICIYKKYEYKITLVFMLEESLWDENLTKHPCCFISINGEKISIKN